MNENGHGVVGTAKELAAIYAKRDGRCPEYLYRCFLGAIKSLGLERGRAARYSYREAEALYKEVCRIFPPRP